MTDRNLDLPPDTEARLDLLVAEWVEHRGLSTARTEQLRRVVLAMHEPDAAPPAVAGSPLDQGPEWWSSLFTPLLTTLSQAATSGYQSVGAAGEACFPLRFLKPVTCYPLCGRSSARRFHRSHRGPRLALRLRSCQNLICAASLSPSRSR